MKAVVYEKPRSIIIQEIPCPIPARNQVLIRVHACGICKTDLHTYNGGFLAVYPLIPGHEFSGEIVEMGSDVEGLMIGDRVVADNTVLCGHCDYCKKDQPLYCDNFYSLGNNAPGGFAEYVVVNFDKVFKISESLSFLDAVFIEPVACAIHGIDMINLHFGDEVLLFGAGPTGMILAQLLKNAGAGRVVVAAPTAIKLELLNKYGITETILVDRNDSSIHEQILHQKYPKGFDIIVDGTGYAPMLESCFKFTKKGSKIVAYGLYNEREGITVNPYKMFADELKFIGSFAQTHCFNRAIRCLENGQVRVDGMISKVFPLNEYEAGLKCVMAGNSNMKIVITP